MIIAFRWQLPILPVTTLMMRMEVFPFRSINRVTVKSELLCFVSDKCDTLPVNQLVDICMNFCKENEIVSARNILLANNAGLLKRKGTNKLNATMEDVVTVVLKPTVKLPVFFATELSRLPPVDLKHCDMAAILIELHGLRAEVRDIAKVQAELTVLRVTSHRLEQDVSKLKQDLLVLRDEVQDVAKVKSDMVVLRSEVQQLSSNTSGVAVTEGSVALIAATAPSAAQVISAAIKTGSLQQASKHKTKCAVGTSTRSKLLSAKVMKPLLPALTVTQSVQTSRPMSTIHWSLITYLRIPSRFNAYN